MEARDLAAAMLLLQVVGLRELYFSPIMEICYGAIFALLLVGLVDRDPGLSKRLSLGAWCAFALLLVTSHPEHFITYLVIVALFLPWRADLKRSLALLILPTTMWAVMKLIFLSDYEAGRLAAVASPMAQSGNLIGNALNALHAWIVLMPETLALLLILGAISWRRRALLRFGIPLFGALLVLFAVCLARPIDGVDRDLESAFFPIAVIVVVSASKVWNVSHRSALHWPVIAIAACLFCLRIGTISTASIPLTSRVNAIQAICDQALAQDHQKVIVPFERTLPRYSWEWSVPMESLLISAAQSSKCVSVITSEDLIAVPALADLPEHDVAVRRWDVLPMDQLKAPWNAIAPTAYSTLPVSQIAERSTLDQQSLGVGTIVADHL